MAFSSPPPLVPIDNSRLDFNDINNSTFKEILNAAPVKRLFNQPNIIIKSISSLTNSKSDSTQNSSEASSTSGRGSPKDEYNLLECKKVGETESEITLLPIHQKPKPCGHYEPCENIICDVTVQQYVDHTGSLPLLAVDIDDSEITARVTKHCSNSKCDTLNIEHNRCRRAVICLYRCDKSSLCDICRTPLKTRKARVYHKKCKRKIVYQHNLVNGAQVWRRRMRDRELELREALKNKQNDYSNPVAAMEVLKNNSEIIVIPRASSLPSPHDFIPTHNLNLDDPVESPSPVFNNSNNYYYFNNSSADVINSVNNVFENKTVGEKMNNQDKSNESAPKLQTNKNIYITTMTPANLAQLKFNNCVINPFNNSLVQTINPFLMPVKVIPIKNLRSEPSLKHQTQGIPRFCIVPDNSVVTVPSFLSIQAFANIQAVAAQSGNHKPTNVRIEDQEKEENDDDEDYHVNQEENVSSKMKYRETKAAEKHATPPVVIKPRKSSGYKKKYENKHLQCNYCSKTFLTDWYFKLHVSRHEGATKAKCKVCNMAFTNNYDLKKHMNTEHKNVETGEHKNNENNKKSKLKCDEDSNSFASSDDNKVQDDISDLKDISCLDENSEAENMNGNTFNDVDEKEIKA